MKKVMALVMILIMSLSTVSAFAAGETVAVSSIKLNKTKVTLKMGNALTLKATIKPANATKTKVKWASSKATIAKVSSKGKVTPVKPGTATITATASNGKTAKCVVTVVRHPSKISLEKKATIYVGSILTLKPKLQPSDSVKTLKWKSSNPKVAKVSKGEITALKTGVTTITATTVNGKKATCTVTVKKRKKLGEDDFKFRVKGKLYDVPLTAKEAKRTFKKYIWYYLMESYEFIYGDYDNNNGFIIFYDEKDQKFIEIVLCGKHYQTYRGIRTGHTKKQMISAYGKPTKTYLAWEGEEVYVYKFMANKKIYFLKFSYNPQKNDDIITQIAISTEQN